MSAISFGRRGPPLRNVGYCVFMANIPATLMTGTLSSPTMPLTSPKDPGGKLQSDHRPLRSYPSSVRAKNAVLKRSPLRSNSWASSGG